MKKHALLCLLAAGLAACASPLTPGFKPNGAYRKGELVARFALPQADQDVLLAKYHLTRLTGDVSGRQLLGVPEGQELDLTTRLRQEPGVTVAEPNYVVRTQQIPGSFHVLMTPNDDAWKNDGQLIANQDRLWGQRAIKADTAWDTTAGTPSVLVATIDTGADMSHPDLQANLDAADALNLVEANAPVDDDFGHGTHVAGIIAAVGNNSIGVIGVAWKCRVMPIRVLGVDGSGSSFATSQATDYAVQKGAKVINMSLGSPDDSQEEDDAIQAAIQAGVVVVAASGNEALDGNYIEYPAAIPGVIGVGAVGPDRKRALFSNYNSFVAVCAPGVDILSTIPSRMYPGSPYGYLSGTSMATPFVSGVAALTFAAHPGWTGDQVAAQVIATAQHLSPDNSTGANVFFGNGLVDASQAIR